MNGRVPPGKDVIGLEADADGPPETTDWGLGWQPWEYAGIGPCPRRSSSGIFTIKKELVIFGGCRHSTTLSPRKSDRTADIWQFSRRMGQWKQLCPSGSSPIARMGHALVYDPLRHCAYLYGGLTSEGYKCDFFKLMLDKHVWRKIPLKGHFPSKRAHHAVVLWNECLVLFGGCATRQFYNDLYLLELGQMHWKSIKPSPTCKLPKPRSGCAYHIVNEHYLIVHGGWNRFDYLNDCWLLNLLNFDWIPLKTFGDIPCGRAFHSGATYKHYFVIYGGNNATGSLHDIYALDLVSYQWHRLTAPATGPGHRTDHVTVTHNHEMVVFGGYVDEAGVAVNDLWSCDFEQLCEGL